MEAVSTAVLTGTPGARRLVTSATAMDAALARLRADGFDVRDENVARLSPVVADLATGRAGWAELSASQRAELAAAVEAEAWKALTTRAQLDTSVVSPRYACGMAANVGGRRPGLFGVLRPCPALVGRCPELLHERVFVRNAREARLLTEVGLDPARITHFDVPDYEQTALCRVTVPTRAQARACTSKPSYCPPTQLPSPGSIWKTCPPPSRHCCG
ncbi:hypothetical protein [Kitasatospora sp. NPDC005856]|uniref:hypothetical protein n=1 Tax=Kitasatospora sp. NPDC005856 TaxID=3154566 RepID=UPI0033CAC85B